MDTGEKEKKETTIIEPAEEPVPAKRESPPEPVEVPEQAPAKTPA